MVAVFAVLTVAFEVCSAVLIAFLAPFAAVLLVLATLALVLILPFTRSAETCADSFVFMVLFTDSAVLCS
mgnify:CR=1 FL=1